MREYNVNVNFNTGIIDTEDIIVVQNDYNSTKLIFSFDKDYSDNTIVLQIKYPNGESYVNTLVNNEFILKHINDDNEIVSMLTEVGEYRFNLVLYSGDSKLSTTRTKTFEVRYDLVDNSSEIELDDRLPILDELINETTNINITASKQDDKTIIEITKKDGTTETVEVLDGATGEQGPQGEPGNGIYELVNQEINIATLEPGIYQISGENTVIKIHNYTFTEYNLIPNEVNTLFVVKANGSYTFGIVLRPVYNTTGDNNFKMCLFSYTMDHGYVYKELGTHNVLFKDGEGTVPTGGTVGQVLSKLSDSDFDTGWVDMNLDNYATKKYVDDQIGSINTILATLTTPEVTE